MGTKKRNKQPQALLLTRDLRREYEPDEFAVGLLKRTFPWWLSDRLCRQAMDTLRGYNKAMALEIADNLVDYYTRGVRHYIGIRYVDCMLHSMYNKFQYCAKQKGIILPGQF